MPGATPVAHDGPEERLTKAAGMGDQEPTGAQRHAQRKAHDKTANEWKRKRAADDADDPESGVRTSFPDISEEARAADQWSRGESNPRPVTVNSPPLHA